jgi:hypothetical protein
LVIEGSVGFAAQERKKNKKKKNHKPLDIFTQPLYVGCEQTPGPFHTMLT